MQTSSADSRLVAERYRLEGQLGSGGMGTVWRGRDERLKRSVAVKEVIIPDGMPPAETERLRERYLREARAAARLRHPSVVGVYDVIPEPGRVWIVMELVDARDLAAILRAEGPIAPARAAKIGLQILDGLDAAHEAGVLHRDVKPANVLICADDRAVLTDFGVASVTGDASLTRTGQLIGSPAYLAPERVTGGKIGPPTDLWSLGCTLYAAVEGKPPFARDEQFAIIAAITLEPIPPPRSAGLLRPVLYGLLEKEQDARWDSRRTRAALEAVATGGAVDRHSGWGSPPTAPEAEDQVTARTPSPPKAAPTARREGGDGDRPGQGGQREAAVRGQAVARGHAAPAVAHAVASVAAPSKTRGTLDDVQPPQRRGGKTALRVVLALILLLSLGGIAAVITLRPDLLRQIGGATETPSAEPSTEAPPTSGPPSPQPPQPLYRARRSVQLGVTVEAPAAWEGDCPRSDTCRFNRLDPKDREQSRVSGVNTLYVYVHPAGGLLPFDLAKKESAKYEKNGTDFPDYNRLRLEPAPTKSFPDGSMLEFTYTNATAGPRHVIVYRTVKNDTSYEVSLNAPADTFEQDLTAFDHAVQTLKLLK